MIGQHCKLKFEYHFSIDDVEFIIPKGRTGIIDRSHNGAFFFVRFDMGNHFIRIKLNNNEVEIC